LTSPALETGKQKTKNFKKVFMLNLQKRIYTTTEEIYDDILKIY
jgi:hypothetical protein